MAEPEAPIDAEFEPANPKPKRLLPAKPGWLTVGSVGLIALIALALPVLRGAMQGPAEPDTRLSEKVDGLTTTLAEISAAQAALKNDLQQVQQARAAQDTSLAQTQQSTSALETRLSELERDIQAVRLAQSALTEITSPDGTPVIAATDPELIARLDALEAAQAAPAASGETGMTGSGMQAINELRAAIAELQEEAETTAAPAEVDPSVEAALALSAIEAAARRDRPFVAAHQKLQLALPDSPHVAALAPLSLTGVRSLEVLRQDFESLRNDALDRDAETIGGSASWMRAILGDGVKVRKTGETSTVDLLDTAGQALDDNRLDIAVDLVRELKPDVQTVFTEWLNSAGERLTLEQALEGLRLTMIAKERP